MSEKSSVPDIEKFEMEVDELDPEDNVLKDIFEKEVQTKEDDRGTGKAILKHPVVEKRSEKFKLDDKAVAEINRSRDPSYTNIKFPYNMICQKRLAEKMKKIRMLFKVEGMNLVAEQTSAFEAVRIRRVYKTGIALPERIFFEHEKGYTFTERERLTYLMNNKLE